MIAASEVAWQLPISPRPAGCSLSDLKLAQVAGICNPSFLYYKDL